MTEWEIDGKADGWNYCIPFIKIWHARGYFDNVVEFKKYFVIIWLFFFLPILFFASILIKLFYLNHTKNNRVNIII